MQYSFKFIMAVKLKYRRRKQITFNFKIGHYVLHVKLLQDLQNLLHADVL